MEYTISELAKLAGISTRTLRYYDDIGLLKPAKITPAGYRIYCDKEVDLLQQILFFKELNVPLDQISSIINDPKFDFLTALQNHLEKLKMKQIQLEKLVSSVEKTIAHMKGEVQMSNQEKFEAFKETLIAENEKQYGKEIREKYGNDVVDASNKKLQFLSETEFNDKENLEKQILTLLKDALTTQDYTSPLAKELVELHTKWIKLSWPKYSKEAHMGLADMYLADERFTAYYDKVGENATKFLRDAIHHFLK